MPMTGNTFGLEVYASDKLFYAGRAQALIVPATDGLHELLAHHANIVIAIIPGIMRLRDDQGTWSEVAVSSGFVEMVNNRVKVFALTAERPEDIDVRRAQEARERAEEQLRQQESRKEYLINKMALARAMARLRVSGHKKV